MKMGNLQRSSPPPQLYIISSASVALSQQAPTPNIKRYLSCQSFFFFFSLFFLLFLSAVGCDRPRISDRALGVLEVHVRAHERQHPLEVVAVLDQLLLRDVACPRDGDHCVGQPGLVGAGL